MIEAKNLRCEYLKNPIGLDVDKPRISWRIESDKREVIQSAYHLQISEDGFFNSILWDSGKTMSEESIQIQIDNIHLKPRYRYYYRVKVWDQSNNESEWSKISFWETGILNDKWDAEWIAASTDIDQSGASPLLRKTFSLTKEIKSARAYATSLGLYNIYINGERVGDKYFTPGWTSYDHRVQYQAYDVTPLLEKGDNAIGMLLGNGWYKGYLGFQNKNKLYGERMAGLLELYIYYKDGSEEKVTTDQGWKASSGPVQMSEIYHGEFYDARLEKKGWSTGEYNDSDWQRVEVVPHRKDHIIYQQNEPIRKINQLSPKGFIRTPQGDLVLDMGQNMVGWLRFNINGNRGKKVSLVHGEVLDKNGNFYIDNLRSAKQTNTYILKGGNTDEVYEPHFTFQGFRYVKLDGFPESITLDDFTGIVLHSDMQHTGNFKCSNALVNQLHHNILWGQKGNFIDVPTDCPQRDERLGWTGDAQMFVRTATYLKNVAPFFTKWLKDLKANQLESGGVPYVIPDILKETDENLGGVTHSSAAWGDAAVIIPWTLYLSYGDIRILEEQYESMKSWVEYIRTQGDSEYLWDTGFHLGDWLGLDSKPDEYVGATDKTFIATAFYAYCTKLLTRTASIIGAKEDSNEYNELYNSIIKRFQHEFVTPAGRLSVPTQTAHVLALIFNLVDGKVKERTADRLVELIKERDYHLSTGFVGTPYLNLALSENGYHDIACKLLLQEDYPSWLYQITKGATTVWEHWDSIKEDGSFWSDDMNSFNHYAYGSIGEWLYKVIAGVNTDEYKPGYKHAIISPKPGAELSWVDFNFDCLYGEIQSFWKEENGLFTFVVTIPPNTTATIILPEARPSEVNESGNPIDESVGIKKISPSNQDLTIEIGSGNYQFTYFKE